MARKLKCWKEKKQKAQKLWINEGRKESVVVTEINPLLPKSENYQVISFKKGKGKLIDWKNSKNKSIAKAQSYMNKHNKC